MQDSGKPVNFYNRRKRQDGVEALRNFGVCFGDIAPEIREKNPDKRIYIMVKTARAPSVLFKAASGGPSYSFYRISLVILILLFQFYVFVSVFAYV